MKITDELLYKYVPKAREIWLETIPDQDENTDFTPSEAFQRQMDEVLAQAQRTSRFKKLLRGALAALCLLSLLLADAGPFAALPSAAAVTAQKTASRSMQSSAVDTRIALFIFFTLFH